jgi:hypothetical protein
VKVVSPFMWYEDRLFVVAEYERFAGGPKVKTGFYTSRGESVENTEHMAATWQPCLGINKGDGVRWASLPGEGDGLFFNDEFNMLPQYPATGSLLIFRPDGAGG